MQRAVQVSFLVSPTPLPQWVGKGPAITEGGYLIQPWYWEKGNRKWERLVVFLTGVLPGRHIPCAEGR